MTIGAPAWLGLIISVPTRKATARMRVWRGLKALGCGVLRDGVYLLPKTGDAEEALAQEAAEVASAGGTASLVALSTTDERQELGWRRLFDRSDEYSRLIHQLQSLQAATKTLAPAALARKLGVLERNFGEISAIDFFPGAAREQAQRLLEETERNIRSALSPDEPHAVARPIAQLRRADYRRRTWATRKRPWIDRLASAWLIKRFIDRDAKFLWIDTPRDCPARAVGFDFDGAEFTHVGNRVTFEVLLAAFGLADDRALARLAMAVHYLDTGGIPVHDAGGLNTILLGARSRAKSDDQLLSDSLKIFDFVYSAYNEHAPDDK